MADKKKYPDPVLSPDGIFKWPKLTEPDYGNKKFSKPDGYFEVVLVFQDDNPEAQEFVAQIDAWAEESLKEVSAANQKKAKAAKKPWGPVNLPYTVGTDDDGNENGTIEVKFRMTHSGDIKKDGEPTGKKWYRWPTLFDADNNVIDRDDIIIYGGTIGCVSFTPNLYQNASAKDASVSLRMEGVQILKLVGPGQKSAEDLGFKKREDGYTHKSKVSTSTAADDGDDGEDDDGEADF